MLAGEDTKALEVISRYQSPADLTKAFLEQRTKLSQRAEPAKLPDNPTAEQIGEWRKGLGLPDVAPDAKPEAFLSAYKIEPPKGYEMSEVERGMVSDYAKEAYAGGLQPREVKSAVDFFFRQQAANKQASNRIDVDRQKGWQNALRDELGANEYDAQTEAATAWLSEQFGEDQDTLNEIRTARLPGGGVLGDHPWFVKLIAKQAMGDGYTDRIMGNAMEAGAGKSLADQQRELEGLQFKDRGAYDRAMAKGGKYEKILEARLARGEIDDQGREVRRKRA